MWQITVHDNCNSAVFKGELPLCKPIHLQLIILVVIKIPNTADTHNVGSLLRTYSSSPPLPRGQNWSLGKAPWDLVHRWCLIKEEWVSEGLSLFAPQNDWHCCCCLRINELSEALCTLWSSAVTATVFKSTFWASLKIGYWNTSRISKRRLNCK